MKIVKKIAEVILSFLGIVLFLIGLYLLFNALQTHNPKKLTEQQVKLYLKALDPEKSNPYYFVADKFDTHDIVFVGEMHKRKQDLEFFSKLIPYLYETRKIKIIGWEFGAADYQKDADSVVNASTFDRKKAISILRRTDYGWCFEEYLEIFHTIWLVNRTVKNTTDRIKFLQLNAPYNPRKRSSTDTAIRNAEMKTYFDNVFPGIVEKEVLDKNRKILIYCGLHHSLTKFFTPKFLFLKDSGRGGQYLYKKYPGKIFQIVMLSPFYPKWFLFKGDQSAWVYPFDGVFNQLYDTLKRPFAVNANYQPFAEVRDFNSFYAFDSWNGVRLKDFCDGAVMIAPFNEIEPIHIIKDWATTQQDLDEVKSVLPLADAKNIHTQQDLYKYMSPEDDRTQIKSIHRLPKFW